MGTVANIVLKPCQVFWNDVDLGYTDGDIEPKLEETGIEITAHQEGPTVLDMIRTGKKVELELKLKETSTSQLQTLLAVGGGNTGAVAEVSTVACVADVSGSLNNKLFFIGAAGGLKYAVWFNVNSAGTDPSVPGYTSVAVALSTGATADAVADAVASALDGLAAFTAPNPGASTVTVTNATAGIVAETLDTGNSGFTLTRTVVGTNALYGWGTSKNGQSMIADAQKLVLHPVANDPTNYDEDICFWKAYPMLSSIVISGENPRMFSVTFKVFNDSTQDDAVSLLAFGDHT